jgi:hypothetical protein
MFDSYEQAREQLRRICLMPTISASSKDCRAVVEDALFIWLASSKPEAAFYGWAEAEVACIAAQATLLAERENYPVPMAIKVAAGFYPNST